MGALTSGELTEAREDVTRTLHVEDLVIVRTSPGEPDPYGGVTPGETTRTPVRGRVTFPESQLRLTEVKVGDAAEVRVALPWGTDVRTTDALEYDGATVSVTRVMSGTTALETVVRGVLGG